VPARAGLLENHGVRTHQLKGHIRIDGERCKGCSLCTAFCAKKSISLSEELNLKGYFMAAFDPAADCNGCGNCALMCPEVAIEVARA
jgi:2-oxoglutarate ferredoxin oxidoreductase subunit delta